MPAIYINILILPLHTFQEKRSRQQIFLSRLEMNPNKKTISKIREDIRTKTIEVNIESTGIAEEKQFSFDTTDQQETTEKELWTRKEEARNAIPNDPPVITLSCYYANGLHKDTAIVNIAQLAKASRILIEKDSDPTLLNFKREMLNTADFLSRLEMDPKEKIMLKNREKIFQRN